MTPSLVAARASQAFHKALQSIYRSVAASDSFPGMASLLGANRALSLAGFSSSSSNSGLYGGTLAAPAPSLPYRQQYLQYQQLPCSRQQLSMHGTTLRALSTACSSSSSSSSSTCAAAATSSGVVASSRAPPPQRSRSSRNTASSGGSRSAAGSDLRKLRGVGPANEELLKQQRILRVADLHQLYTGRFNSSPDQLALFLQEQVGIRRQHSDMIAAAMKLWEAQQGVAAADEAGAPGGSNHMVTLAVEGNISAGKSTFLDVLSHEETSLRELLKVVQEPVKQWQAYPCTDRYGRSKQENVLAKFYENPNRFAYSFQHYVLISRMEQDRKTRGVGKPLRVLERSIFSDRQVFVRAMHRSGTMEDFEVSVYNQIFDQQLQDDLDLVPDGFVYLRAQPGTCMQRLRKRSRSEEVGISQEYLEMLHDNHEDWLKHGVSPREILRDPANFVAAQAAGGVGSGLGLQLNAGAGASVLKRCSDDALRAYEASTPGLLRHNWRLELIEHVPELIKDQVLLLKGQAHLPQLRNRLALVMDHDQDIDIHNDVAARREYAEKISAFYNFVQDWKRKEAEEAGVVAQAAAQELHEVAREAAIIAVQNFTKRKLHQAVA